jgi:hypothetical protein
VPLCELLWSSGAHPLLSSPSSAVSHSLKPGATSSSGAPCSGCSCPRSSAALRRRGLLLRRRRPGRRGRSWPPSSGAASTTRSRGCRVAPLTLLLDCWCSPARRRRPPHGGRRGARGTEEDDEEDEDESSKKQLSPVSVLEQRLFEHSPPPHAQTSSSPLQPAGRLLCGSASSPIQQGNYALPSAPSILLN